jgi:recombination protein RecA
VAKKSKAQLEKEKAAVERKQRLTALIASAEKIYGKGVITALQGELAYKDRDQEVVHTGSYKMDEILGIGGWPFGRIVEIFGDEGSGKTTTALQAIAQCQALGHACAFIDAEHALDKNYAEALGVKLDEMLLSQPDYGEQALHVVDMMVASGTLRCIVVDSVAALVPKAELDGDMGDTHIGLQARLMSQAMRKLAGAVLRNNVLLIFINQTRMKIGMGNPKTTSGGKALKFYASVRMEITRIGAVKKGEDIIGNRTKVKVVKNRLAPPFRQCEIELIYGKGISWQGELLDMATEQGLIKKSGSWYAYGDTKIAQGRQAALWWMEDNPDEVEKLKGLVFA